MAKKQQVVFGPKSYKQRLFMTDNTTNIVLYGGGAGAGKSYCALLKQLECINDPDARIVFIRNTRPQLIAPGALIDESKTIYSHFNPKFRNDILEYTFPSGCKISFKALNTKQDLPGYDGTQFTRVIFDEVQNQYGEEAVIYLMSRLRSKSKLHHQMVFTANPRECWLKEWVEYCLDEDGVPLPGTEDRIRWFVRINNKMHWADSPDVLENQFPGSRPLSFRFIPATCLDNPVLLQARPDYIPFLQSLKKVDQLRLWKGSWSARESQESYFDRDWCPVVTEVPPGLKKVRAWDLAASPEPVPGVSSGDPDYSASVLMGRSSTGQYYVLDVYRFRKRTSEVIEEMIKVAHADGVDEVEVVITKDPGAAGAHFAQFLTRTLVEHGIQPRIIVSSGHSNKLKRFMPFSAIAQTGNVSVLKASWNKDWYEELEGFTGSVRGYHDDMADATADAANSLMKQSTIPSFTLNVSEFSKSSPIQN